MHSALILYYTKRKEKKAVGLIITLVVVAHWLPLFDRLGLLFAKIKLKNSRPINMRKFNTCFLYSILRMDRVKQSYKIDGPLLREVNIS